MAETSKYPWILSAFLLLIYLSTAKYTNSIPVLPGVFPVTLADAVFAPRFFSTAVAGLLLILYLILKKSKSIRLPYSWILILYGIIVLSYFVFIPAAINQSEALFKAVLELQYFIILIAVTAYLKSFSFPLLQLSRALLPITIVHVVVLCIQFGYILPHGLPDHAASYRLTGLMSHRNLAAQVSILLIPFTFYNLVSFRKKIWMLLQFLLIITLFALIFFSYSRAVWLASVAAVFVFIILVLTRYRFWFRKLKIKRLWIIASSVVATATIIVLLAFFSTSTVKDQFNSLKNPTYGSASERFELWEISMEEILANPVGGAGGGNWKIMAMRHDVSTVRKNATAGTQVFFQRPHNDYLWKWYEAGLAAFLAFVLIFIFAIDKAGENYFRQQSGSKALGMLLIVALVLIYIILSFFSFPDERPMLKILLTLILALAVLISPSRRKLPPFSLFLMLALQVMIIPVAYLRLSSSAHNHKMQIARLKGELSTVISEGRKAENLVTTLDDVATPFSWYTGEALYFKGELKKAEQDYLRAYSANPYHIHVLNNLGVVYLQTEKLFLAEKYFVQALRISPGFDQCRINYAICLKRLNKLKESIDQLRRISSEELLENSEKIARQLLPAYTWKTAENTDNPELKKTILRIERNKKWMQKIFEKSRKNNISYDEQLLLDATYILQQNENDKKVE